MESSSRRQVLAASGAAVTFAMLQGAVRAARGAGGAGGAATVPAGAGRGGRNAPAEKPGWFSTKLKPGEIQDKTFAAVEGHAVAIAHEGGIYFALSSKCTHQGCGLIITKGSSTIDCPCHGAQYHLDGSVSMPPAKNPLTHYAIRINGEGLIEVDPGSSPKADEANGKLKVETATAPATAPAG